MRIAIGTVVLGLLSIPVPAFGATIFDFDRPPDSSGCNAPVDAAKCAEFLDLLQTGSLGHGEFAIPVFTTEDGIRMDVFQEVAAGFEWQSGVLASLGNIPFSEPLLAEFSAPLKSVQIDLKVLPESQAAIDWIEPAVFLEGFDGNGQLLTRIEAPAIVGLYSTLRIDAPAGQAFRTIRFAGGGLGRIPEVGFDDPFQIPNNSAADNLVVERVIPEPTGFVTFSAGLVSLLWTVRRRGRAVPPPAPRADWWRRQASNLRTASLSR
jgi:hypothetical protein